MVKPTSKGWLKDVLEFQSSGYPIGEPIVIKGPDGEPIICAFVSDVELDVFMVGFGNDEEITFFTEDMSYLLLTPDHIAHIAELQAGAQALVEELDSFRGEDGVLEEGWQSLLTSPNPLLPPS